MGFFFFLKRSSFFFFFQGKIAYVPQQAWMQNATLKNNILFGRDFKKDLYEKVHNYISFFFQIVCTLFGL